MRTDGVVKRKHPLLIRQNRLLVAQIEDLLRGEIFEVDRSLSMKRSGFSPVLLLVRGLSSPFDPSRILRRILLASRNYVGHM